MTFWGKSFIFNDIPCDAYDLMLYDVDGSDDEGEFASPASIEEETVGRKWRPYFYGVRHEGKLKLNLTFGVNTRRIENTSYLDRYELSEIGSWLTGHDGYLNLDIEQEDLRFVRYKVIITELKVVTYSQIPWSLQATAECDGPYAYMYPQTFSCEVDGEATLSIFNRSSLNDYYYPVITFDPQDGELSITNANDNNRVFELSNMPLGTGLITVNNDNCVISCANELNLYPYFNNNFLRLVKGINVLNISGTGTLHVVCEFPINTGG